MNQVIERLTAVWQDGAKLAFLGVGSPLRADDAIGLLIVAALEERLTRIASKQLRFYLGESAPENFSGVIRQFAPDYLIMVDAAEFAAAPGSFRLIQSDEIGGASFCTHMLPLGILANYLEATAGCRVLVVGVQPETLEFGHPVSQRVEQAAGQFVETFVKSVQFQSKTAIF